MSSFSNQGPVIQSINGNPQNHILINGNGFGSKCQQCEVVVDYGKGFKYLASIQSWNDKSIKADIPDLNKGLAVQVSVKTKDAESNKTNYQIKPIVLPAGNLNRIVPAGSVQNLLMFEKKSDLAVGDKGEESYNVNSSLPACNNTGFIFEHAELVQKGRFGEARIISTPNSGCTSCSPLKVRWYHEPTGNLDYQVHVFRRQVQGICQDKVRR